MIVERLLQVALLGSSWVMYLLLGLSVISRLLEVMRGREAWSFDLLGLIAALGLLIWLRLSIFRLRRMPPNDAA